MATMAEKLLRNGFYQGETCSKGECYSQHPLQTLLSVYLDMRLCEQSLSSLTVVSQIGSGVLTSYIFFEISGALVTSHCSEVTVDPAWSAELASRALFISPAEVALVHEF